MEAIDYWRRYDELTLVQAALLIIDLGAKALERDIYQTLDAEPLKSYQAVLTLLTRAINTNILRANQKGGVRAYSMRLKDGLLWEVPASSPDCNEVYVAVSDLKVWLQGQNLYPKFFFPERSTSANDPSQSIHPNYLYISHPNYSFKLATAVNAWEYLTAHPEAIGKGSVKKALEKWLNANASNFHLTDRNGRIYRTAIEEVSKVANWATRGGAPKTSG